MISESFLVNCKQMYTAHYLLSFSVASEKYPIIMKQVWSAMSSTATNWRKVFTVGRYAFPFKIFLLIIFANVESFLLES